MIYYNLQKVENENLEKKKQFILNNIPLKGEYIKLNGKVTITHPNEVVIGSNVHIGDNAYFNSVGGLVIGDNVHISRNVTIYTSSHNYDGALPYDNNFIVKSVIINKNVWIGMNVNISPGVIVGEGAILAQGASISKDVPEFSIVGNPKYRILKTRNIDIYNTHKQANRYGGINGQILPKTYTDKKSANDFGENFIFIVSTGRSGTTTLASVLSQNPDVKCDHEISNIIIRTSTDYEHGKISRSQVVNILNEIYNNKVFEPFLLYGESNQKLSNLIPVLHEILPKAKFIWLLRDGKKVVDSTYARNWYLNETKDQDEHRNFDLLDWDNFRLLGYKTNDYEYHEWNNLTRFEKNCWYWKKWNSIIERDLKEIPEQQKLVIKIEQIAEKIEDISQFLHGYNYNYEVVTTNKSKHTLKGPENWSDFEKRKFEEICGDFYNKYYG